jgi:hypothetical protein
MKKMMIILMAAFIAINLTGCDALQRKFTRKKKAPVKMPRIFQEKKYVKSPTPELYQKHYVYWMTWHSEVLQKLGKNRLRCERCMEELIGHLQDMQNMLVPEKGGELTPHIKNLMTVRDMIMKDDLGKGNETYARMTLEREDRYIKREFSLSKVRKYIRKSFDEEPEAKAVAAEGAGSQ